MHFRCPFSITGTILHFKQWCYQDRKIQDQDQDFQKISRPRPWLITCATVWDSFGASRFSTVFDVLISKNIYTVPSGGFKRRKINVVLVLKFFEGLGLGLGLESSGLDNITGWKHSKSNLIESTSDVWLLIGWISILIS